MNNEVRSTVYEGVINAILKDDTLTESKKLDLFFFFYNVIQKISFSPFEYGLIHKNTAFNVINIWGPSYWLVL